MFQGVQLKIIQETFRRFEWHLRQSQEATGGFKRSQEDLGGIHRLSEGFGAVSGCSKGSQEDLRVSRAFHGILSTFRGLRGISVLLGRIFEGFRRFQGISGVFQEVSR